MTPETLSIRRRAILYMPSWPEKNRYQYRWCVYFADIELKRFATPKLAHEYLQWTKKLPIEVLRNRAYKHDPLRYPAG